MAIRAALCRVPVVVFAAAALLTAGSANAATLSADDLRQLEGSVVRADFAYIEKLVAEGQFDKALAKVESMQSEQPDNAAIRIVKGAVYSARKDRANARKAYEEALALAPNMTLAAMGLARLDLDENNPDRARKRFEAILSIDPSNAQAMMGLAGIARATKQDAEYASWLQKAADAAATDPRPRVLLVGYYLGKHDSRKALSIARSALSISPNDPEVLDALGAAQLADGDRQSAVATYTVLSNIVPNDPYAHFKLASAYVAAGNTNAARSELARTLALNPRAQDAKVLLASVEMKAGKYDDALRIAREIQKDRPKSAVGPMVEGDVLMAQKQFSGALKAYETAFAISKSGILAVKLHQAMTANGKSQEADARLASWLNGQPSDRHARTYLAQAYLTTGRNKQAIEQYQILVKTNPSDVTALNDLAWLYQQEQDPRALATAEEAYRQKPNNAEVIDTLAWVLLQRGDVARSIELLQKAVTLAPNASGIRYHLAVAQTKAGDKPRAGGSSNEPSTRTRNSANARRPRRCSNNCRIDVPAGVDQQGPVQPREGARYWWGGLHRFAHDRCARCGRPHGARARLPGPADPRRARHLPRLYECRRRMYQRRRAKPFGGCFRAGRRGCRLSFRRADRRRAKHVRSA